MVHEQILKRLQDTMKMFMVVLEQLEQLQWTTKDLIEDLEEALLKDSFSGQKEELEKPSVTEKAPAEMAKEGVST